MDLIVLVILFFIFSLCTIRFSIGNNKYFVTLIHSILFALTVHMICPYKNFEGLDCNILDKSRCEKADECWWIQDVVKGCARKNI